MMISTITTINFGILVFFIFSAIIYTMLLIGALPAIIRFFQRATLTNMNGLLAPKELPPVTIITAFYNEEDCIIENVLSSLNSNYGNLYIILVNDGSTDKSFELVKSYFSMREESFAYNQTIKTAAVKALYVSGKYPNLLLIDKENSGVGDSWNVGINVCFTPYFATIDADSIMDEDAISEMLYELLASPDAICVGGGVYILNNCTYQNGKMLDSRMPYRLVPALQGNEYLRSHLFNRTGWNSFGATMSYSGTASLYSRKEVVEVHGYDTDNYAQDTEMVMRLHHHMRLQKKPYQIRFNPSAVVWTDVPNTLREFSKQRDRWQRGIIKSVLNYWRMFLNPRYSTQGLFSYPVYVLLEVIAPLVEFTAYITLSISYYYGILDGTSAILYILLAWGFTTYLTLGNMFINVITFNRYKKVNDIFWMFLLAFIEMFGFRQYYTTVKIWATVHYMINRIRGKAI